MLQIYIKTSYFQVYFYLFFCFSDKIDETVTA